MILIWSPPRPPASADQRSCWLPERRVLFVGSKKGSLPTQGDRVCEGVRQRTRCDTRNIGGRNRKAGPLPPPVKRSNMRTGEWDESEVFGLCEPPFSPSLLVMMRTSAALFARLWGRLFRLSSREKKKKQVQPWVEDVFSNFRYPSPPFQWMLGNPDEDHVLPGSLTLVIGLLKKRVSSRRTRTLLLPWKGRLIWLS